MKSRRSCAREYWTIDAELEHSEQKFPGKLVEFQGAKVEQFSFTTAAQAHEVEVALNAAAHGELTVLSVERKQRKRNPAPPFTTSTLQQEARPQAGLQRAKDHACRAAAVRGRRHRRGPGRSHHLYAHRLAQFVARGESARFAM